MPAVPTRNHLPSLLLLPEPPRPASRHALQTAYRPTLTSVLTRLKDPSRASTLVLAVACPFLDAKGSSPGAQDLSWRDAQRLLAGLYGLVSAICSKNGIATDLSAGPNSIDVRIVFVQFDRTRRLPPVAEFASRGPEHNGTILLDLPTFASTFYPWDRLFHVTSEAGYEVLSLFLQYAETKQKLLQQQLVALDVGTTMAVKPKTDAAATPPSAVATPRGNDSHRVVCLGGTFDHLHPGHKLLLAAAVLLLKVPRKRPGAAPPPPCIFVIGVTGDELLRNKKYAEYVQDWKDRVLGVLDFLSTMLGLPEKGGFNEQATNGDVTMTPGDVRALYREGTILVHCVEIQDPFGPTITVQDMDALVVSGETREGGKAVNEKRREKGWKEMVVYEVDVLDAEDRSDSDGEGSGKVEDFSAKISSTAIRRQRALADGKL